MVNAAKFRDSVRSALHGDAKALLVELIDKANIPVLLHEAAHVKATELIEAIRDLNNPGLMEVFLAEYGLSTQEGVALMCLAEALLRVPDTDTIDALIEDKIAPSAWGDHLGKSSSSLVNASTWALLFTGKVLQDQNDGVAATLKRAIKRVGEPVIRTAVQRAMREMGHQFVLGRTIEEALKRAKPQEKSGYRFSYDMLGEAALTAADARIYFDSYSEAIASIASRCDAASVHKNPGISVKLSALHPRYEVSQKDRVLSELVERTAILAKQAKGAGMGFNIDAEEAARLDLSLDVIEALLKDPQLAGWDGFGIVVQAYGKAAPFVLDWIYELCTQLDRKIMVRLVKGAYWDTEIKHAQVEGLNDFPVFTQKPASDVSYICCARKLLQMTDRIYPQFATHNAHSVAAIMELAEDRDAFEFQRLQGMGESLHEQVRQKAGTHCRIYAPVGTHRDLLAYLVRRLLENGANSSFVNQIVDKEIPASFVAADPFKLLQLDEPKADNALRLPADLYAPDRQNSKGWDLDAKKDLDEINSARAAYINKEWIVSPLTAFPPELKAEAAILNPADPNDRVGGVQNAILDDVAKAAKSAKPWDVPAIERADILCKAADLYEAEFGQVFALLCREAGKTCADAIGELREAVDFLRYYANECKAIEAEPQGVFACISPWNFPLAIFTGQIAAALATGNAVIAKPSEFSPAIAALATGLLHKAGVPKNALQLVPGEGGDIGASLISQPEIKGVCFTGSTQTAQAINRTMAQKLDPSAPLIAETGGLNAMIVDSTALPQQAITDIVTSAFTSAGQRCSALRMLYLQEDIAKPFLEMLYGAMDELRLGNPWDFSTDIGPVINAAARSDIHHHIETARADGRVLHQIDTPKTGHFIAPTVIRVNGIADLEKEIFGPVLHVATFSTDTLDEVIGTINNAGYGLTFGVHSRIDDRIEQITSQIKVGNIYVNRNQIGAIVGSQPFGGEGLSGTGPKAGGPNYLHRFVKDTAKSCPPELPEAPGNFADIREVQVALDAARTNQDRMLNVMELPGPTGESNRLTTYGRGTVLCLGPGFEEARSQADIANQNGCNAMIVALGTPQEKGIDGFLEREKLAVLQGFALVALASEKSDLQAARSALSKRTGPIIPLATTSNLHGYCVIERHICIDTTAAGGNAALLAASS